MGLNGEPQHQTSAIRLRPRDFDLWLSGFRTRAVAQGLRPQVVDRALAPIGFAEDSLRREAHQPEFTRPIWAYLDSAVSDTRIAEGRAKLRQHFSLLRRIEARFGVAPEVVAAIWGIESRYGQLRGTTPVIESLATLAYAGRRRSFFENELLAALKIVEAGEISAEGMLGSWAGAMGHTQFIPSSFLAYAVDFNDDGRRDIWSDDPTDALASAAAYLSRFGWEPGRPAVVEVRLPAAFDFRAVGRTASMAVWRAAGIRAQPGRSLPQTGEARLFLPAGQAGPAFLTFRNFQVIKRYNNADSYALAVAHLADRLRGDGPFHTPWPRSDRALSAAEREELQRLLARRGYYQGEIDGRIGPATIAAVQAWQQAAGLPPDGYVSAALLERLRRG